MIPVSLELVNFFSHKNSSIDFSQFNSALLIGNIDGNYDISNGSGKSSLFESILWCLFNKSRVASMDDIIFWGENYCKVVFVFKHAGDLYRIIRKRSRVNSATYVEFSKMNSEGSWIDISGSTSSLTNVEIEKTIKVDYKTFVNSAYFRQDDISEFAIADPAKKKGILKSIIDISKWDEYEESAKNTLKEIKLESKLLSSRLEGYDELIKEHELTNSMLLDLKNELEVLNEQRVRKNESLQNIMLKYNEIKESLNTDLWDKTVVQIEQLKKEAGIESDRLKKISNDLQEVRSKILIKSQGIDELLNKLKELKTDDSIDKLILELNEQRLQYQVKSNLSRAILDNLKKHEIVAGICYVCNQDISNELYQNLIIKHQEQIDEQTKEELFSKNKIKELELLKVEYQNIVQNNKTRDNFLLKIKNLENDLSNLKEKDNELSNKLSESKVKIEKHKEELSICNQIIESIRNESFKELQKEIFVQKEYLNELSNKIEKKNMNYGIQLEKTSNLKNKIDGLQEAKKEFLEKQKRISVLEKAIKLLGKNGIQTILLNAIIEDLEKTSNEILTSICNEQFTIFLDTQRVGADGNSVVDTLDLRVKKEGVIQNFKSLSSGEQFRISLALRIALSEISSRHGGSALEFLLLDEINSPLDRHGTESLFVNVIKSLEKKYKILVITHNDSLKEKFTNILDVTKTNGESNISFFSV